MCLAKFLVIPRMGGVPEVPLNVDLLDTIIVLCPYFSLVMSESLYNADLNLPYT